MTNSLWNVWIIKQCKYFRARTFVKLYRYIRYRDMLMFVGYKTWVEETFAAAASSFQDISKSNLKGKLFKTEAIFVKISISSRQYMSLMSTVIFSDTSS